MPDEVAGTPSGEVGSDKKPCGWKMNLSRRFIGIGEEIDVLGGDELVSRMEAFETAYLDAARQAFTYLKTQYDQLICEPPCHKHWDYDPGWNVFSRLMLQAYDGLYLIEVTDHLVNPGDVNPKYRATVTVSCHYILSCIPERLGAPPDVGDLLDHVKSVLRR